MFWEVGFPIICIAAISFFVGMFIGVNINIERKYPS